MKRFMIILAVLVLVCVEALACSDVLLPKDEGTKAACGGVTVLTGCSSWALEADSRELAGIKYPDEELPVKKGYTGPKTYIRGQAQGGLIRFKCMIQISVVAGEVLGLKTLENVKFYVPVQYEGLVAEILERRVGCSELSAAGIAAATLWRRGDTVGHIFWPDETPTLQVIEVVFNGGEFSTYIYAGDFDGDEQLELGFRFGIPFPTITKEPEPTATPEPEPEATPKPQKQEPAATPKCQKNQTVKVCWDWGIDLKVWFKGCITWLKGCCGK